MYCTIEDEGEGQFTATLHDDAGNWILKAELLADFSEAYEAANAMLANAKGTR